MKRLPIDTGDTLESLARPFTTSMDPEFAAAYEKRLLAAQAAPADPSTPSKSFVEIERERMKLVLGAAAQYHSAKLPLESAYIVEDRQIQVEKGEIRARCLIPSADNTDETFPAFVWFHGGGWYLGDVHSDDNQLRSICVELRIVIVNVEYRLAPEYPFPTGVNDSYAAAKWVVDKAPSLRVSPSKGFILGGDSAGGNIAAVVAHLVRKDPFFEGQEVTGQLLREPVIVHPDAYPEEHKAVLRSLEEFKNGPLLTRDVILRCGECLKAPPADPRYSPLLFPSHTGLAPAFITYNGRDGLRDENLLYDRVLSDAGVKTKAVHYPNVPHGFYYACPEISLSAKVELDTKEGLKWLLARS